MKILKENYLVIAAQKFSLNNDTSHASLIIGVDPKEEIITTHDPNSVIDPFCKRSVYEFEVISISPQPGKIDTFVIYLGPESRK